MTYTCRGLRLSVKTKLAQLRRERNAMQRRIDATPEEHLSPLVKKMREKCQAIEALEQLPDDHDLGRQGCGHDLAGQINAIPDDGEVYEYECPACGNTGTVHKAPVAG